MQGRVIRTETSYLHRGKLFVERRVIRTETSYSYRDELFVDTDTSPVPSK